MLYLHTGQGVFNIGQVYFLSPFCQLAHILDIFPLFLFFFTFFLLDVILIVPCVILLCTQFYFVYR